MPDELIPITKPFMDERDADAARRAILSGWVTQGPEVAAFEREFAAFTGATHACAVSSCTTALHLALLAVGVKPGDEVVTVSHSYIATANSIRYCGATPVFIDIERSTFNMNPDLLDRAISGRTRAILCVHQVGMPLNIEAVLRVSQEHSIPVIEDAACAIGSEILWKGQWQKIGKPHGEIACFSFHPRKVITTGDGGMLTTSSGEFDRKFRLRRQHSMSLSDTVRHSASQVKFDEYPELGYNYRMTDIQAAVGREQLKRLPEIISRRRELAARYGTLLSNVPGVTAPDEPSFARSNWQSYSVRLPDACDQIQIMQFMLVRGIATRRGIMCSHREPAYSNGEYRAASHLTESEAAQDHCIILPLFHQMTVEEQDRVVSALRAAVAFAAQPASANR
ncbi:MAG: aminotransferase DegT [Acidobacteria bacterium]|nr:MAG: aminotransferase DegT [Acidobacteriota bacterium]